MLPPKGLRVLIISNLDKSGWPDYGHLTVSNLSHRLPHWLGSKESACNAGDAGDMGSIPGSGKSRGEGNGNPLQYQVATRLGKSHGQRGLVGYRP